MDDPSSDEEQATTASETEAESEDDDEATPPEEPWCPPIPPAMDDPTEQEIKGAADKLATMISSSQPSASVFYHPDNLGALPHLWLQAKLTISHLAHASMQEKFARLFMSIASELWLRGVIESVEEVFAHAARSFTLRLAETLSQYICSPHSKSRVPSYPRDGVPAICHFLVSSNPLRTHCGGQRERRGEPKACPQWPCQSCRHEPAPLTAASYWG